MRKFLCTMILVLAAFFSAGAQSFDSDLKALYGTVAPDFTASYGDYIQYLPGITPFALKACGLESASSWSRMFVSAGFGAVLTFGVTEAVKLGVARMRPDGTTANSFPSGHSATAYLGATWLQVEYGDRYPWIGACGYTVAAATALQRVLANRHWTTDTFAGAVVGVLCAELGYRIGDLVLKGKGINFGREEYCYDPLGLKYWSVDYFYGWKTSSRGNGALCGLQAGIPLRPGLCAALRFTAQSWLFGNDSEHSIYGTVGAGAAKTWPLAPHWEAAASVLAGCAFGNSGNPGGGGAVFDLSAGGSVAWVINNSCKVRALVEYEQLGSAATLTLGAGAGLYF